MKLVLNYPKTRKNKVIVSKVCKVTAVSSTWHVSTWVPCHSSSVHRLSFLAARDVLLFVQNDFCITAPSMQLEGRVSWKYWPL